MRIWSIFYSRRFKKEWNAFIKRLINEVVDNHKFDGQVGICVSVLDALPENKYRKRISKRMFKELDNKYKSLKYTYRYKEVTPTEVKMQDMYYWPSHKLFPRIGWLNSLKF